jgi:tetratricopeptide (TPR) repeat protein
MSIKTFGEALQANPYDHSIYADRSSVHLKLKDFEKALEDVETALVLAPQAMIGY